MQNPAPIGIQQRGIRTDALTPSESAVLAALNRYHYLTAAQVCRLRYSRGSLTYVQTLLKRLSDQGFCQRLFLPRASQQGSAPSVYTLGRRGLAHLRGLGLEVRHRYRPSEQQRHSYLFLNHTLTLNEFLIDVELSARQLPQLQLVALLHEYELKRRPFRVDTGKEQLTVVPDAWLDLRLKGRFQVCLLVELDMGTEEQKAWRRKVRGLLFLAAGPYQEAFGTTSLTFAVVVATGERRLRELIEWTEAELQAAGEAQQAGLFLFATCPPLELPPDSLLFTPCWYQPLGDGHALALFDGVG